MWKQTVHNNFAYISVCAVLALSTGFMYIENARYLDARTKEQASATALQSMGPLLNKKLFKNLSLEAQAVYVYDITTDRVLYQKNADTQLPLASITKVMTALIASELATAQTTSITISPTAIASDGDTGLIAGEAWNMSDLISFTLINSSNDGATAIAETFPRFVDTMNTRAKDLGLSSLVFNNPTGLDIEVASTSISAGGYGSAKDVAQLMVHIVKHRPTLLESTTATSSTFRSTSASHTAYNTNPMIESLPNLVASKTGYTILADGNLAVVFNRGPQQPVVAVVLGSSFDGRFSDILSLASTTLRAYNGQQ